jgi:hypothetical protein
VSRDILGRKPGEEPASSSAASNGPGFVSLFKGHPMKQGAKAYRVALPVVVFCLLAAAGAGLWIQHVVSHPPGGTRLTGTGRIQRPMAAGAQSDLVLGPYATQVSESSAKVLWLAKAGAEVRCEVLPEAGAPGAKVGTKDLPLTDVKDVLHEATIEGLAADHLVRYRVTCGEDHAEGTFRTLPAAGATTEFRFFVYGDSRSHPQSHRLVTGAMAAEGSAAFVIHTGDFASNGDDAAAWEEEFFDPAADLLRSTALWPIRGNHEGGGLYFRQFFDQPRGRIGYSFDCGNLHVVVIDQYREIDLGYGDPNGRQETIDWLQKDLSSSKAQWLLVADHEPTYNVGGHASSWGRDDVLPVLEKCGVDLVIGGHSHLYERFRPIGPKGVKPIIHVVTGGGGAELYPGRESKLLEAGESCLHYCSFRVKGNELEMTAKTPDGREIDHFKLVKTDGTYQKEIMDRALTTEEADKE